MKRSLLIFASFFFVVFIYAAKLTIMHTNDTHAAYRKRAYSGTETTVHLGGYTALEYHLNKIRSANERTIYLDAGDQQTGSVFSSFEYKGLKGGAILEVFHRLGLDAATLGNHEFDVSYAHAQALVQNAQYPFISTNLLDANGKSFGRAPYQIIEKDGLNIGILGLTLVELPEKVKTENVAPLTILPYKEAIDRVLDDVDSASDLIVLLTHNGWEADSLLASTLDDRIDLIIGGHSHIVIDEPTQVNGIYILSAGSHLALLGVADIEVQNDRITSFNSRMEPLTQAPDEYYSDLSLFIDEQTLELETTLGKVAGYLPFDFEVNKYQVTQGSQWIADALLAEYAGFGAKLSLINNGGLRKHLPKGEVSLKDLHEYIPFGNTVTFFSCYGKDLLTFAEKNRKNAIDKPYDILSTSAPGMNQATKNQFYVSNGEILDPDAVYRIVSHDYIASQWDKYLGFQPFDVYDTGDLFLDAIIQQVSKQFSK